MIDAEMRAIMYPTTFSVPSFQERSSLVVGQHAKIGVESPDKEGERFWVKVTEVVNHGYYVGQIDNDLVRTESHGLKYLDLIFFKAKHILSLHVPTEEEALEEMARRKILSIDICAHCGRIHRGKEH